MSDDLLLELARCLRHARKERKLTQGELEILSGVPERTISRIENGRQNPSFSMLYYLVRALNMPADQLFFKDTSTFRNEVALLERNYSVSNATGRKIILEMSNMISENEREADKDE